MQKEECGLEREGKITIGSSCSGSGKRRGDKGMPLGRVFMKGGQADIIPPS